MGERLIPILTETKTSLLSIINGFERKRWIRSATRPASSGAFSRISPHQRHQAVIKVYLTNRFGQVNANPSLPCQLGISPAGPLMGRQFTVIGIIIHN